MDGGVVDDRLKFWLECVGPKRALARALEEGGKPLQIKMLEYLSGYYDTPIRIDTQAIKTTRIIRRLSLPDGDEIQVVEDKENLYQ